MFLRCRNSPAPCGRGGLARGSAPGPRQPLRRVASLPGGRLEHTPPPSGRGKIRVSRVAFLPAPRAGVCSSASRDRRERAPTPPAPCGSGVQGVNPLPHPSPKAMVKCAFQDLGQTQGKGLLGMLASD